MTEYSEDEKANLNFFGNSVNISMRLDELEAFLNEMQKYIEVTHYHLQTNNIKGYDLDTLDNLKYHFEHTHSELLRNSIIISLASILETEIDIYCMDFKKHKKTRVSYKDFRGDFLNRFKLYSTKIIGTSFEFSSTLWSDIIGIYEIRNCLVHNNGLLDGYGKRGIIEDFVSKHRSFAITENDFVDVTFQGCFESINTVREFFDEQTKFALLCFPGEY